MRYLHESMGYHSSQKVHAPVCLFNKNLQKFYPEEAGLESGGSGIQNLQTDTLIDLEQVSYLLFPDGTKLMAPWADLSLGRLSYSYQKEDTLLGILFLCCT